MWPMWTCICTFRSFEETYDNTLWRQMEQMQSMWLFISSGTNENPRWIKIVIMHQLGQGIWRNIWKCALWRKISQVQPMGQMQSMYQFWLVILGHKWKPMLEKNCSNVTNVIMHQFRQAIWGNIWKHTLEKNHTMAINVSLHLFRQEIWGQFENALLKEMHTCNQCDFASIRAGELRTDFETHIATNVILHRFWRSV